MPQARKKLGAHHQLAKARCIKQRTSIADYALQRLVGAKLHPSERIANPRYVLFLHDALVDQRDQSDNELVADMQTPCRRRDAQDALQIAMLGVRSDR